MANRHAEYFGTPDQHRRQQRASWLWNLVGHLPDYTCHGRVVGLAAFCDSNLQQQMSLAHLQGVAPVDGMPRTRLAARCAALEAAGFTTDVYDHWEGLIATFNAAAKLSKRGLPTDLVVHAIGPETPSADLTELDHLTQSCDVLLPMGSFLRGNERPSVFLFAKERAGRVVGAAGAVAQFHPAHSKADTVWWGMLSTRADRRGAGIALVLGALVLRDIQDKFGYSRCFTGIRAGNLGSERLCTKLALARTDTVDLLAISPQAFRDARMTK